MTKKVRAAVRTAPRTTELREFDVPALGPDEALVRMEVAGICGTDVKLYDNPVIGGPVIMGHENVGIVENAGQAFTRFHGVEDGDRIFIEHYVGCYHCEWCRSGEFRHCRATDWRINPDARRYGYTPSTNHGTLWGGFAEYMYLPWNAVVHKVPESVTAELAGLVTPLSNGIEWALFSAQVGYADTVLIQGPGQQGLSQLVASKQAGASMIIMTGTTRDRARLELAKELGADHVIDILATPPLEAVMDLTGGCGVDKVLDCTSRAGTAPLLLGVDALKRREGVLLIQGELAAFPDFPVKKITEKAITIKSARGHSFKACELALDQLTSGRFPLHKLATHRFVLDDVDLAIRTMGGEGVADVIHISLLPGMTREQVAALGAGQ